MSVDQPVPTARPYTVLAVCTGNICRSPAVERLFAAGLGVDSGVQVGSAGVAAVVGAPLSAPMASLLRAAGISPDGFAARQVTDQMLQASDLVLALTKAHRSWIVEVCPSAVRRTFTLLGLARLAGTVDAAALPAGSAGERLAALLPLAAAQRGRHHVLLDADDVVDPYRGDDALYRRAFGELQPAVAEIIRVVRGT